MSLIKTFPLIFSALQGARTSYVAIALLYVFYLYLILVYIAIMYISYCYVSYNHCTVIKETQIPSKMCSGELMGNTHP